MVFVLKKFLFCLHLKLGGYVMAISGMIFALLLVFATVSFIYVEIFPFAHNFLVSQSIAAGFYVFMGFSTVSLAAIYFYFSYQLLMGTRKVSENPYENHKKFSS